MVGITDFFAFVSLLLFKTGLPSHETERRVKKLRKKIVNIYSNS